MTNNYGRNQYPEKLIPKSAFRMHRGLPALLHGDGSYLRSWLHVQDSVEALFTIMERGESNTIYNVHGDTELQNLEVVRRIARILDVPEDKSYVLVPNRVGQDIRYSLDDSRLRALGWRPTRDFVRTARDRVNDDFKRFLNLPLRTRSVKTFLNPRQGAARSQRPLPIRSRMRRQDQTLIGGIQSVQVILKRYRARKPF
jgi:dTDP-glucose 4,6-dehydratase